MEYAEPEILIIQFLLPLGQEDQLFVQLEPLLQLIHLSQLLTQQQIGNVMEVEEDQMRTVLPQEQVCQLELLLKR